MGPGTNDQGLSRFHMDRVRAGKVRYVGCSNAARALGLTRYETLQPRYNLLYREIETELLLYARQEQLGVIVYNPIAGGLLSGKYAAGEAPREGTRFTIRGAGEIYRARYWDETRLTAARRRWPGSWPSPASPRRSSARAVRSSSTPPWPARSSRSTRSWRSSATRSGGACRAVPSPTATAERCLDLQQARLRA